MFQRIRLAGARRYAAALLFILVSAKYSCTNAFGGTVARADFDLPAIAAPASQPPARLFVGAPLREALARGLVVIPYRTDNLRIVEVYGRAGLKIVPRIGHLHITLDDAPWHWVDASGEPIIIQFLPPGRHNVLIQLADPTHHVIDSRKVFFEIPSRPARPLLR